MRKRACEDSTSHSLFFHPCTDEVVEMLCIVRANQFHRTAMGWGCLLFPGDSWSRRVGFCLSLFVLYHVDACSAHDVACPQWLKQEAGEPASSRPSEGCSSASSLRSDSGSSSPAWRGGAGSPFLCTWVEERPFG